MAETDDGGGARAGGLRQHALAPLDRAIERAARERREVAAEREAFLAFADRVSSLEATRVDAEMNAVRSLEPGPDAAARARTAYAETVMAVDHYDREYGEPLLEHVANELGATVATALAPDGTSAFTTVVQGTITAAAGRAVASRADLLESTEAELESLRDARDRLVDLLDGGDAACGPVGADDPTGTLEAIAADRQETIHRHHSVSAIDGHDLCEYLYADQPWTYPVLLALSRLRDELDH
jgi:hypothetical protein